jgi:hypothetical protein
VSTDPLGVGTATDRHPPPFHASAIGVGVPEGWSKSSPTDRQVVGEPQEIVLPRMNREELTTASGPGPEDAEDAEDTEDAAAAGTALPPAMTRAAAVTNAEMTILRT